MGTADGVAPTLRLSPGRAEPAGRGGATEFERPRGGVTVKDRARADQRAGLPARATVKLPKRLDLARDAGRAADALPGLIVANWGNTGDNVTRLIGAVRAFRNLIAGSV